MIKLRNLSKNFGNIQVLSDLELSFPDQGIVAILGPNASGKSTLINSILGKVIPDNGEIDLYGKSIVSRFDYRKNISYLPQYCKFPENLKVKELISMMKELRPGMTREKELISLFRLEKETNKRVGTLSGGTKQKVNLVIALMYDCPILLLDEPSNGLDPLALIELKKFLIHEKQKGKLIILTTHMIDFVESLADDVIFLLEGKIYFQGTLQELLRREQKQKLESAIAQILKPHVENI